MSAAAVPSEAAASTCGSIKIGDGGTICRSKTWESASSPVPSRSSRMVFLEAGGDARRRSLARNDNGTVDVGDQELKRIEPTVGSSWKTIEPPIFTTSESAPNTFYLPLCSARNSKCRCLVPKGIYSPRCGVDLTHEYTTTDSLHEHSPVPLPHFISLRESAQ